MDILLVKIRKEIIQKKNAIINVNKKKSNKNEIKRAYIKYFLG